MDNNIELKKKQNRLLLLAFENKINRSFHFSDEPGTPTIEELQHKLFPEYEKEIDFAIKFLTEHIIKPTKTKDKYPTLWEIDQRRNLSFKDILDEHGICQ